MASGHTKSVLRAFPRREPFLAALSERPDTKFAAKAAGISRNSVYTHLRRYPQFRRQWQRALERGRDKLYRPQRKQLAADPRCQRMLERVRGSSRDQSWHYLVLKHFIG